jgi:benzoyl-CoA 2,3-dioxygenase component B
VNVEEGRHLWAMVYLLHRHFGRDGREEAEALLERRSGDVDNPRILGAFNERTPDWLAFFMFTYFTDRDGKFQLTRWPSRASTRSRARRSSCSPRKRTTCSSASPAVAACMQRTCEVMKAIGSEDPDQVRAAGAIDLPTMQRYLNFHYSVTIDLFGPTSRRTRRSSTARAQGSLRGDEARRRSRAEGRDVRDPRAGRRQGDGLVDRDVPMLNALNEVLRDDFIRDFDRRHRAVEQGDGEERRRVSPRRPAQGVQPQDRHLRGIHVTPEGRVVDADAWNAGARAWLPTALDRAFVASLMGRVVEPGRYAGWIAPPPMGVNRQPADFEYIRFN